MPITARIPIRRLSQSEFGDIAYEVMEHVFVDRHRAQLLNYLLLCDTFLCYPFYWQKDGGQKNGDDGEKREYEPPQHSGLLAVLAVLRGTGMHPLRKASDEDIALDACERHYIDFTRCVLPEAVRYFGHGLGATKRFFDGSAAAAGAAATC
jgi:hypothetical protein